MKYRDLKDFLSTLTDDQLDQPVNVLTGTECIQVCEIWTLEEDYINPTGEGLEPVSAYADDPDYADELVIAKAGEIFLMGGGA